MLAAVRLSLSKLPGLTLTFWYTGLERRAMTMKILTKNLKRHTYSDETDKRDDLDQGIDQIWICKYDFILMKHQIGLNWRKAYHGRAHKPWLSREIVQDVSKQHPCTHWRRHTLGAYHADGQSEVQQSSTLDLTIVCTNLCCSCVRVCACDCHVFCT